MQNRHLQKKLAEPKAKEQLVTFEQNDGGNQLEEISYRLQQILKKFLRAGESFEKFKKPTIENIKELIFEVASKFDEQQMKMKQMVAQERALSQDSSHGPITPDRSTRFFGAQDNVSNYASTTDISLILDEREKRLQTKEELIKVKE